MNSTVGDPAAPEGAAGDKDAPGGNETPTTDETEAGDADATSEAAPEATAAPGQDVVAAVYFHGIGEQRRFEEVNRFVESLEKVGRWKGATDDSDPSGGFRPRLERFGGGDDHVGFIQLTQKDKVLGARSARIYECYWSPIATYKHTTREMWFWLLSQISKPVSSINTYWRLRHRWRSSTLIDKHEKAERKAGKSLAYGTSESLLREYKEFDSIKARRKYPEGSFEQFKAHLAGKGLEKEAKAWLSHLQWVEFKTFVQLLTLSAAVAAAVLALVSLVPPILRADFIEMAKQGSATTALDFMKSLFEKDWLRFLIVALTLIGFIRASHFLKSHLGDVRLWSTYEETDERHKKRTAILERAVKVLRHVLEQKEIKRVVIVAHSLGTTIAHDALLELARHNRAHQTSDPLRDPIDLSKIRYFFTMGSPIDKIHYLFESKAMKIRRFADTVENFRGDIGGLPFAEEVADGGGKTKTKRRIRWINFWDQGDVISAALYTPSSIKGPELRVENVHVSNFNLPRLSGSHAGYFDNRLVMGPIHKAIFGSLDDSKPMDPGTTSHAAIIWFASLGVAAWALLIGLSLNIFKPGFASAAVIENAPTGAVILTIGLIFVFLVALVPHQINSLDDPPQHEDD